MALDLSQNFDLRQNFVSAQYLQNTLTEFHQILFILTRSKLELLYIIFGTFVPELWPLIDAKIRDKKVQDWSGFPDWVLAYGLYNVSFFC